MPVRGLRGAIVATANTREAIRCATRELMLALVEANQLEPDDIASVIFTCTPDLTAEAPARTVRELGWGQVALMCVSEMDTPASLRYCIRVLIHWNTEKKAAEVRHVYLRDAAQLRPDWANHNHT
jgi:chorismate mutase